MEYDSQQSISGEIVSLILCVEAGFFQILSHINAQKYRQ